MASADTQARVTVDIEKYVAQLEKRVAEQEQLIALLNDKVARYESEGVASQSYAGLDRMLLSSLSLLGGNTTTFDSLTNSSGVRWTVLN
ncbi:hypothetical protein M8J75_015707 [Diaphorina citri]|nr:hypothetical protein M8J75_015707 [Diaphorina citri]